MLCVIDGLQKVWVLSGCNNTWDRTTLANANLYAHQLAFVVLSIFKSRLRAALHSVLVLLLF